MRSGAICGPSSKVTDTRRRLAPQVLKAWIGDGPRVVGGEVVVVAVVVVVGDGVVVVMVAFRDGVEVWLVEFDDKAKLAGVVLFAASSFFDDVDVVAK